MSEHLIFQVERGGHYGAIRSVYTRKHVEKWQRGRRATASPLAEDVF